MAAGPVNLQGRQLLLHLFLSDPESGGSELGAVDWLLTGAVLAALLALVLTALAVLAVVAGVEMGVRSYTERFTLERVFSAVEATQEEIERLSLRITRLGGRDGFGFGVEILLRNFLRAI